MKDADYNAIKSYCEPLIEGWLARMECDREYVRVKWMDELFHNEVDGHSCNTVATCNADWEYLHATITISAKALEQFFENGICVNTERVEYFICHEIAHILVAEMREYDGANHDKTVKHEERVCTRIAKAFQFTRAQALKERTGMRELETKLDQARHDIALCKKMIAAPHTNNQREKAEIYERLYEVLHGSSMEGAK